MVANKPGLESMQAWLGGKVFEATGSYDWTWYVDILLALGAALVHLPIHEKPLRRAGTVGAAAARALRETSGI